MKKGILVRQREQAQSARLAGTAGDGLNLGVQGEEGEETGGSWATPGNCDIKTGNCALI